jgi:uncharacterized protein (DUF2267 family)
MQTITISLPEHVFQQVEQKSRRNQRTVAAEVVAAILETIPEALPPTVADHLAQLDAMSIPDLFAAAQLTAPPEKQARMQALLEKQSLEGLLPAEAEEAHQLAQFFNQIMLARAKAAVLLQRQGMTLPLER